MHAIRHHNVSEDAIADDDQLILFDWIPQRGEISTDARYTTICWFE